MPQAIEGTNQSYSVLQMESPHLTAESKRKCKKYKRIKKSRLMFFKIFA